MHQLSGETAQILDALGPGQRFWFWLCEDLPPEQPALLLTSLHQDPGMDELRAQIAQLRLPLGARQHMGLGAVGEDGRLSLGAAGLSAETLARLAAWVHANHAERPALARLSGTRLLALSGERVVQASFAEPSLWEGLPPVPAAGSLDEAAARLSQLAVGEDLWTWMSAGPQGVALVVVPEAHGLVALRTRMAIAGRELAAQPTLSGLLRRLPDGGLSLIVDGELAAAAAVVAGLLAEAGAPLSMLRGLRLLQVVDGKVVAARHVGSVQATPDPVLLRQGALLETLTEDTRLVFWFARTSRLGSPVLLLETEPSALKAAAQGLAGEDTARGRARLNPRGWLELRLQAPYPELLPLLVAYVRAHRSQIPALERLRGTRLLIQEAEDGPVEKIKDSEAWEALEGTP